MEGKKICHILKGELSMKNLTNTIYCRESDDLMWRQETEVLLGVLRSTLGSMAPNAVRAVFLMDGQKSGEEAKCIFESEMVVDGHPEHLFYYEGRTLMRLAEESIDEILVMPGKSKFTEGNSGQGWLQTVVRSVDDVVSGIWSKDKLLALVLNTAQGRFVASCYLADRYGKLDPERAQAILLAVAQAILELRPEDGTLQAFQMSLRQALHDAEQKRDSPTRAALVLVEGMFGRDQNVYRAISAWRENTVSK